MVSLSKQEVARRQLVTAINLFFDHGDSVSIYTLGQAAWEVLDALCKNQEKIRIREEIKKVNSLTSKEVYKISTYGRNFFKHADKDPEATLEGFKDEFNDLVLFAASYDYTQISGHSPIELQLFKLWYFAVYPEKAPKEGFEDIIEAANENFPDIQKETRAKQKLAGKERLIKARKDVTILKAPDTDTSPTGPI